MTGACSNPAKTNDSPCNDGNACTQTDSCQVGTCVGDSPKACTASDQCHQAGVCDPMTGACSNPPKANGAPCSDGNACTQTDSCQSGTCVGASPETCTASDPCHLAGVCDPMTGACSNPPKTCTASDQCHQAGVCDPMTGACSNPPKANGAPCSDGNACTPADSCQSGVCVSGGTPPDTSCNNVDENCDGTADEGYVPVVTTCGVGICAAQGATRCEGGATLDSCTPLCLPSGTFENPAPTCRNVLETGGSQGDGYYYLRRPNGTPYLTYCNMGVDGGGWTALFLGINGPHVFDHFDDGSYAGLDDDPRTGQYLQRAPLALGDAAAEIAVECGPAMVAFALTQPVLNFLVSGAQSGWQDLTPRVIAGSVANVPNAVFTGDPTPGSPNDGFIFSKDRGSFTATFGASYASNNWFDYCNGVADTTSTLRVYYREVAATPIRNTPAQAASSCRSILRANGSNGDGLYWLAQPSMPAYLAYCDMTIDGGGWTAVYSGRNGSTNVVDHFDSPSYQGSCPDPASRCLRRAPPMLADTSSELAVSCGNAMVAFATTQAAQHWLVTGTRSNWIGLTPRVLSGAFPNVPNALFTGSSDTNLSFIFARDNAPFANTFASSFAGNDTFDSCANTPDQASLVRVLYREADPEPVLNTPQAAANSCRAVVLAGQSQGNGMYWLSQGVGPPYLAYCDMTTDGGGWTAVFSGQNGSTHVFDHFDAGAHLGTCTDPAARCVRRAPPTLADSASELAVSCGPAMVAFAMTQAAQDWLVSGVAVDWIDLTPRVLTGAPPNVPTSLFTGTPTNRSFIFSRNRASFANTFASSYAGNDWYDACANVPDRVSRVRVFYREADPTPILNTPATASLSCRRILDADPGAPSGVYWLQEPAGSPYAAYCDMTTDGGGWTAVFSGRNGSTNVFDHFDSPTYQGICTDPATHCLRRAPPSAGHSAAELGVWCGTSAVRFALTEQAREWVTAGTRRNWIVLSPTVVSGTFANVPNSLFTGVSDASLSFVFARNNATFENAFASSYLNNTWFDSCANVPDAASLVRVAYRESPPAPVLNTQPNARASCRAVLAAGESQGDGLYWLTPEGPPAALGYCDMTTDGGGWTAVFSGRNGSTNVFDRFDVGFHQGTCTDPATRCVRRAPSTLPSSGAQLLAACGASAVEFDLPAAARNWMVSGAQAGWVPLTSPQVLAGSMANVPNALWTGSGSNAGFILTRNNATYANVFMSSYLSNDWYDHCANTFDQASLIRLFYREP
jgi:hypothetical protein